MENQSKKSYLEAKNELEKERKENDEIKKYLGELDKSLLWNWEMVEGYCRTRRRPKRYRYLLKSYQFNFKYKKYNELNKIHMICNLKWTNKINY